MIRTEEITLLSEGGFHAFNITDQVRDVVQRSGIGEGSALVFYRHTSGAVVIIEHEAGILVDLEDVLEKLIPVGADYTHHRRGYDLNGAAHVRTAFLGVSVTVPVAQADLLLGTYQEIIVIDMDPERKTRSVVIQVTGE